MLCRPVENTATGPLTEGYRFGTVSLRYPNNWIVDDSGKYEIRIAPAAAFLKGKDGPTSSVTQSLFLSILKESLRSRSTDEVLKILAEQAVQQGAISHFRLTRVDKGSYAEMLNTNTSYAGTETVLVCALRLGNAYVVTQMFSPTGEWNQYKQVFSRILESFSEAIIPTPGPLTTKYAIPGVASFRYPDNWIVVASAKDKDVVTVGPPSGFYNLGGQSNRTHCLVISGGMLEHPYRPAMNTGAIFGTQIASYHAKICALPGVRRSRWFSWLGLWCG